MRTWPVLFMLFAVTVAHGQRSEVPEQPQPSVSHIRGYLANPIAARIPNAVITLQKQKAGVFVDVQSIESSSTGEFDFGKKSLGVYQLVARARGFCQIAFPITVSESGWLGLRIALPIAFTGPSSGGCHGFKIGPLKD